jgi:transcriptional regulator with XRE-family HTH domain
MLGNMTPILTKYRKAKGATLLEMGKALGVDKSTLMRWEHGRVPPERLAEIERLTGIPRRKLRPDIFGKISSARSCGSNAGG